MIFLGCEAFLNMEHGLASYRNVICQLFLAAVCTASCQGGCRIAARTLCACACVLMFVEMLFSPWLFRKDLLFHLSDDFYCVTDKLVNILTSVNFSTVSV